MKTLSPDATQRRLTPLIAAVAMLAPAQAQPDADPALPPYRPSEAPLTGTIRTVGSDAMAELTAQWLERFRTIHPRVVGTVEAKGSSTAVPALLDDRADLGLMSRDLKVGETERFTGHFGHPPTRLATCIDGLAVFVHVDNPLTALSFPQVDAIFSEHRKRGHPEDITTWGQLGLAGEWKATPISLHGRNAASGAYGLFKKQALGGGAFKSELANTPGRPVQALASRPGGIGFDRIGNGTAHVRPLPLAVDPDSKPVPPTTGPLYSGDYPLARPMVLVVPGAPGGLKPTVREFLRFVYSHQGQEIAAAAGFVPLDAHAAAAEAKKAGLTRGEK